jgi:hypothetical protein
MEAIVAFVVVVIALGVFAHRLGFDSRSGPSSPEQAYSHFGLTWGGSDSKLSGQHLMERGPHPPIRRVSPQ